MDILTRLVRPSVIRECENDILKIDYTLEKNQLFDKGLDLGSFANDLWKNLNSKSRAEIFSNARNFFMKALDYMKTSFPLKSDILTHASSLDICKREEWEFSSVAFFSSKFKALALCDEDTLRDEFKDFQSFTFTPKIENEKRMDIKVSKISTLRSDIDNRLLFLNICKLLLAVFCIPHSNADWERIFSVMKKNLTEARASMSTKTVESLLVSKLNTSPDMTLGDEVLKRCKKATREHLLASSHH